MPIILFPQTAPETFIYVPPEVVDHDLTGITPVDELTNVNDGEVVVNSDITRLFIQEGYWGKSRAGILIGRADILNSKASLLLGRADLEEK